MACTSCVLIYFEYITCSHVYLYVLNMLHLVIHKCERHSSTQIAHLLWNTFNFFYYWKEACKFQLCSWLVWFCFLICIINVFIYFLAIPNVYLLQCYVTVASIAVLAFLNSECICNISSSCFFFFFLWIHM